MTPPQNNPAKKIATLGLAGTVITSSLTGITSLDHAHALPQDTPNPTPTELSPAQPAPTQSAPTEAEIEKAREAVHAAQNTQVELETRRDAKEVERVKATEILDTYTAEETAAQKDQERLKELAEAELSLTQEANQRALEQAEEKQRTQARVEQDANQKLTTARTHLNEAKEEHTQAQTNRQQAEDAYAARVTEADREVTGTNPTSADLAERVTKIENSAGQNEDYIQAQAELDRLTGEHEQAQRALEESQNALNRAQEQLTEAQNTNKSAQEAHAQAQEQLQAAREKLTDAQTNTGTDSENPEEELHTLEERISATQTEIEQLQNALNHKENTLRQAQKAEEEITASLPQLQENVRNAQRSLNDLTALIDALTTELAEHDTARKALETELNQLNDNISTIEESSTDVTFTRDELIAPLGTNMALYRVENGVATRVVELADTPDTYEGYVVRGTSANGLTLTLPVKDIKLKNEGSTNVFVVTAVTPEGVLTQGDAQVTIRQTGQAQTGVYTTFSSLIQALQSGVTEVRLANDVYADEIALSDTANAYVTRPFSGVFDGAGHTIHGLVKPLFETIGIDSPTSDPTASVSNVVLKDVQINGTRDTAALAQYSRNSLISYVHIDGGTIRGGVNVAGLISQATHVIAANNTVRANLNINHNGRDSNNGGIAGYISGGRWTGLAYRGNITTSFQNSGGNRVGGLIGQMVNNARLMSSYAQGTITNTRPSAQVGGLVGSTWSTTGELSRVQNNMSAMRVNQGHLIHGDRGFVNPQIRNNMAIEGEASGKTDNKVDYVFVDTSSAEQHYKNLIRNGAATTTPDLRLEPSSNNSASAERADRQLAYRNYEKLLPYATRDAIVRAANKLANDDLLVTETLKAAIPTIDKKISIDTFADADAINGVLLHFAHKKIQHRALIRDDRSGNSSGPAYYYMANGLPFTPSQLQAVDSTFVDKLLQQLRGIEFDAVPISTIYRAPEWTAIIDKEHAAAVRTAQGKNQPEPTREAIETVVAERLKGRLYLRETFAKQKETLAEQLRYLIARESILPSSHLVTPSIEKKILDNKEALLLGLAYVNKWYNIAVGANNVRDFFMFRRDFYGTNETPLDALIRLGQRQVLLDPRKNHETYRQMLAAHTGRNEVANALDDLRQQFTQYSTFDDWFKATTKIHLIETKSQVARDIDVTLSKRLREVGRYKHFLLPILTVSDDSAFVTVHMTNIGFGFFDRYIDKKKVSAEQKPEVVARLKEELKVYTKKYRDYYDMWYRIGNEKMRQNLNNHFPTWDGFHVSKEYGPEASRAIEELYGPVGQWFPSNGNLGYSNGFATWMVLSTYMGGDDGIVTYTHEMVHNAERLVFLGGHGRRPYASPEVYPNDLLQNIGGIGFDNWGFNQSNYFTDNGGAYLHNKHPDRFQSITDLDQYYKGYFDALYMLDNAEAEVILERTPEDHANLFMRLGSHPEGTRYSLNSYNKLSADQIRMMNLSSIDDLIDNELMIRRGQRQTGPLGWNGYWDVRILEPMYGTGETTTTGMPGESAFKRNAYELLAARGYHQGFVGYTSNKYAAQAQAAGVPNMPDSFIMPKIFNGEFDSLKAYRKHAYAENKKRAKAQMRPITVQFEGREHVFTSYDQLVERFRELLTDDFNRKRQNNRNQSRVYAFKRAVFSQLMRQTDEFKTSIFADGDEALTPWTPPSEEIIDPPYVPQLVDTPVLEVNDARFTRAILPESRDDSELARLHERQRELSERIAALREDSESLSRAQLDLVADKAQAELALADAQQAHREAEEQIRVKQAERESLHAQVQQATAIRDAASARKDADERRFAVLSQQWQSAKARIEAARQELAQAEEAVRDRETAREQAGAVLREANAAVGVARDDVAAKEGALATVADQVEAVRARVNAAHHSGSALEAELVRLRALLVASRKLDTARELEKNAASGVADATEAVRGAEKALAAARQRVHAVQEELERVRLSWNALADETVDSLVADDTPAQPSAVLHDLIVRFRKASEALRAAREHVRVQRVVVEERTRAVEECTHHIARVSHERAEAEAELARLLRLKNEATVPGVHRVPDTAPTVAPLPEFVIPAEWLDSSNPHGNSGSSGVENGKPSADKHHALPKTAPTVQSLPEFVIPDTWLTTLGTQPGTSVQPGAGIHNDGVPHGDAHEKQGLHNNAIAQAGSSRTLATTGAESGTLALYAALTASTGWLMVRRGRQHGRSLRHRKSAEN